MGGGVSSPAAPIERQSEGANAAGRRPSEISVTVAKPTAPAMPSKPPNVLMRTFSYGKEVAKQAGVVIDGAVAVVQKAAYTTDGMIRRSQVSSLTKEQVASVRALYDAGDVRKNGALDKQELRHALFKLTNKWLSAEELDVFWLEIDSDGSNTVSFEEFLAHAGPALYPPVTYQIMRAAADQAERLKQMGKDAAEEAAIAATDPVIDLVVSRVHELLLENVVDMDMPVIIQHAAKRVIAEAVEDLAIEVKEITKHNLRKLPPEREPPNYKSTLYRYLKGGRAWFLYSLFPYDRSVWVQLKDPSFYLLKAFSIYPPPVQPLFFILQFLLMDHRDEYQLVRFILVFKSSQFFSIGIISTFVGASYYYNADGEEVLFPISVLSIGLFLAQVTVVWLAFLLLPFSKEKGKNPEDMADESDFIGECCGVRRYKGRGGRLAQLFLYDLFCFIALALLGVSAYALDTTNSISSFGDLSMLGVSQETIESWGGTRENRRLAEQLYWARTLYGVLALPFMIFMLPIAGDLLTHTMPTAYDQYGRTTPMLDARNLALRAKERRMKAEMAASERELQGKGFFTSPCLRFRGSSTRGRVGSVGARTDAEQAAGGMPMGDKQGLASSRV